MREHSHKSTISRLSRVSFIVALVVFSVSLFHLFSPHPVVAQSTITRLVNFNTTNTLIDEFNPNTGSTQFTNVSSGGISNTGAISVPLGSNELWATKQGYTVTGAGDVYTFSAFFKIAANSGYGGLGFIAGSPVGSLDGTGHPVKGIGMSFHGGGGSFVNNQSHTNVSWPPDLVLGNWYKMIFTITAKGSNTYDLNFQIWNADANGTVGSLKTEKVLTNIVNNDLGQASIINIYFSAAGSRMSYIDDFQLELAGNVVIVEEGEPVVQTADTVADITHESAVSGGVVVDDQGASVTARGVCWSTTTEPTTSDDCTTDGAGTGSFVSTITGLESDTEYFVRAYATNAEGTSYGAERVFTTDSAVEPTPTPTPTSTPAPTPTPSPSPSNQPQIQTNTGNRAKAAPTCLDAPLADSPNLFQIDVRDTQATLYFSPLGGADRYFIAYGEGNATGSHGVEFAHTDNSGVVWFTINDLLPSSPYTFVVRGGNGCMPGSWSNQLQITTTKNSQSGMTFYTNYPSRILHIFSDRLLIQPAL